MSRITLSIVDAFFEPVDQDVVVDPVEDWLAIGPRPPPRVCPTDVRPRGLDRIVRPSARGRNPWLWSLKLGSMRGCSTCSSACWISRSVTVRDAQLALAAVRFGDHDLRTGLGR